MPRPFQTILSLLLLAAPAIAQTHRYQVLDLGVLSGQSQSSASAINAAGAVVGNSGNRPFVFRNCTIRDLGILPNGFGATATGINNDGAVSGYAEGSDQGIHAVDWHDSAIHLLLAGNTYQSQGLGITNTGRVIGYEYNGAADFGIAFDDDLPIIVPSDDDPTYGWASVNVATGGNSSGQFVGYRQIYNSLNQFQLQLGLVTLPGTSTWQRINPPSSFTGDVYPWAINESGATSGWIRHYAGANVSDHAFLSRTTAAAATDLGTLGGTTSHGYALNNARWVVGSSTNANNTALAFLYDGISMIDLNTTLINPTGWQLVSANGINDYNQIVGTGIHNGVTRAFLLNPITSTLPVSIIQLPCSTSILRLSLNE